MKRDPSLWQNVFAALALALCFFVIVYAAVIGWQYPDLTQRRLLLMTWKVQVPSLTLAIVCMIIVNVMDRRR